MWIITFSVMNNIHIATSPQTKTIIYLDFLLHITSSFGLKNASKGDDSVVRGQENLAKDSTSSSATDVGKHITQNPDEAIICIDSYALQLHDTSAAFNGLHAKGCLGLTGGILACRCEG